MLCYAAAADYSTAPVMRPMGQFALPQRLSTAITRFLKRETGLIKLDRFALADSKATNSVVHAYENSPEVSKTGARDKIWPVI